MVLLYVVGFVQLLLDVYLLIFVNGYDLRLVIVFYDF